MNFRNLKILFGLAAALFMFAEAGYAKKKKKFHCEVKKDGKVTDMMDVKSRKKCKKLGGEWVKEHDHDHDHEGHDHDHDE